MFGLPGVNQWTFGAEHELGDWDTQVSLPTGFQRSPDYTIVNSNGVAAQPNPRVYRYGGEINTPPTTTIKKQVQCLKTIQQCYPNCVVNHRSNLHLHIRIPGLLDNLAALKHLQQYIHVALPEVIDLVEPIPVGTTPTSKKRERRRRVSHHTLLTSQRLQHQLEASTVKEFFEREVPCTKVGKPMWHAQPRLAVGLRQLLQTDTIEFRHFPGTLSLDELHTCLSWCKDFLVWALHNWSVISLWEKYQSCQWPIFPAFDEELEIGYQATASHNGLSQQEIKHNIQLILKGTFHASPAYQEAKERAGCLPRKYL